MKLVGARSWAVRSTDAVRSKGRNALISTVRPAAVLAVLLTGIVVLPLEATTPVGATTAPTVTVDSDVCYSSAACPPPATNPSSATDLDVYLPPETGQGQDVPGVILIHGGDWVSGDKSKLQTEAEQIAQYGWVAFNINYRLDGYPGEIDDVMAAVVWVRQHASQYGVDPSSLGVLGTSSGGNLSAMIATTGASYGADVAAVVSWSGGMDLTALEGNTDAPPPNTLEHTVYNYMGQCAPSGISENKKPACPNNYTGASPVDNVTSSTVPMFIANSTNEVIPLSQAQEMSNDLANAGVPHQLYVLNGTLHGTAYAPFAMAPTMSFLSTYFHLITLTVTDCSGSPTDTGSLPYAVAHASFGDTITFGAGVSCPLSSPIVLASTIYIDTYLTIDGPGAASLVVSGNNAVPVFTIPGKTAIISGPTATISGLTIEDGHSASSGGGIVNSGTLTVNDSTISGNNAISEGGGIFSEGSSSNTTVTNSTVSGNSASNGGGIENAGTLVVTNSTVSGNSASVNGGAIQNLKALTVTSSTFSGNAASHGGGINMAAGLVTLGATIVAGNTGSNCYASGGTVTSVGYNLSDDLSTANTCDLVAPSDVLGANPQLGPLANNGGPTETELPALSSPAVYQIPTPTTLNGVTVCPGTDQRGLARPLPGATDCTIGAVEP